MKEKKFQRSWEGTLQVIPFLTLVKHLLDCTTMSRHSCAEQHNMICSVLFKNLIVYLSWEMDDESQSSNIEQAAP